MNLEDILIREAQSFGISINKEQSDKFRQYFSLLVEWNEKVNLTSIIDPIGVARKHFVDSLLLLKDIDMENIRNIIDVGTGAGFPGIPLKIMQPHLELVLLDSLQKRCKFLEEVKNQLHLNNVYVLHGRAELVAQEKAYREKFDVATARAVANLRVISEYCIPFVKVGGCFVAPKGKDGKIEAGEAHDALAILGAEILNINTYELPEDAGIRNNIIIKKNKTTPIKYPRKAGLPEKKPL